MRRDAGGHTNCDSLGSIDEKMGNSRRKDTWLFLRLIKVRHKIHNVFIKVCQQGFLADFLKTCFCISHCCGTISLDGTKISMAVNERQSFLEILAHHNQRFIDGAVSVGMVFTHGIADDTGTFTVGAVTADAQLMHIVESSSLYRF